MKKRWCVLSLCGAVLSSVIAVRATALCVGDCAGTGQVTITGIISLVAIALGEEPASTCASGIPPGVSVDISLIIQAVNNALNGCVATTPTGGPTRTPTAAPTQTPKPPPAVCVCSQVYDPVCGCDAQTYYNACAAGCAGTTVCSPGRCGVPPSGCICPQGYDPVCGCDGQTYSNACAAGCAGITVCSVGLCSPSGSHPPCGGIAGLQCCGFAGLQCPQNSVCQFVDSLDPTCATVDLRGVCVPSIEACAGGGDKVCGCDRVTYPNDCSRLAAGVTRAHKGPCPTPPPPSGGQCAGIAGLPCQSGEVCNLQDSTCSILDLAGVCVLRPEFCPELYDPVCGCDGVTYPNDCFRLQAGAIRAHTGPCPTRPPPLQCASIPCGGSCFIYPQGPEDFIEVGTCAVVENNCTCVPSPPPPSQCASIPCGGDCLIRPSCSPGKACPQYIAQGTCAVVGDNCTCRTSACGGIGGMECPSNYLCDFRDPTCSTVDLGGVCVPGPEVCPGGDDPVCGCNGVTYPNDCSRLQAGATLAHTGPCFCVGDCNGDGTVTPDEPLTCDSIKSGRTPLAECAACDADGDGTVTAGEVTKAMGNQLHGCGPGTICFANKEPTSFDVTLDTSLKTASVMEVDLAVLYQGSGGNPISDATIDGGCSSALGRLGSFTYLNKPGLNQPGMVRFTLQSATPRQIPTSPLFSCNIDSFYANSIVVSCLSGNIDGRAVICCPKPFQTIFGPVPLGNGCCQFNGSCQNIDAAICPIFGGQPLGGGLVCDQGEGECREPQ